MILAASLVVLVVVVAILWRAEVRLALLLGALALGTLAGQPMVIVQTFLEYFTREQFLVPIGCCMGFAYVLRETECDKHLIHLLLRPLQRVRALLIPGIVLVGTLVNVPIISQSSTAIAVGSVLVPILAAAGLSATTVGASLALGSSIGGELLNPGAPELRSVSMASGASSLECVEHVWPLLLVHLGVTVPLFWFLCWRAEARWSGGEGLATKSTPLSPGAAATGIHDDFRVHYFKALVPLIPLLLLFLTALPDRFRLLTVPEEWLVSKEARTGSFDSRLIGAAMLVGVVIAALTAPGKAGNTAKVFFEGAGHALTNVTALIVAAGCFGKGVELVGIASPMQEVIRSIPQLLLPLAALIPLGFAWISGSGMASTQSLFEFYVDPARVVSEDPLRVGAVVSLSAAAGRTMSPVAAVVLMSASLTGARPMLMIRRMALPLLAGIVAVVLTAMILSSRATSLEAIGWKG